MQKKWFRILITGITLALMIMIFFFSTESAEASDATSGMIARRVADIIRPDWKEMEEEPRTVFYNSVQFAVRKTAHFTEFAMLGACMLLCLKSWLGELRYLKFYAWIGGTAWAVLDEIHQLLVDGRSGQLKDVLLDSSGVACGILIVELIMIALKRKIRPRT